MEASALVELHKAVQSIHFPIDLIAKLATDGECIGECEVLDFKRKSPATDVEYAVTARDILALHNSYGGFIVFGIEEVEKDKSYSICGVSQASLHLQKITDFVRNFSGCDIRIDYRYFKIGVSILEILYVARRSDGDQPVKFAKNGPELKPKNLVFKRDDIVFRRINSNAVAEKPSDYEFLYSHRKPPSIDLSPTKNSILPRILNNLPDRALICSEFIGRGDDLDELWEWLADDFSRARLIAGEGGLGKTSLAYRFCEELINRNVKPFQTITWLSAKSRQFIPSTDDYRDANHVDFQDAESLFKKISSHLGATDEEISSVDLKGSMQLALQSCEAMPSFVVVDDVDSLNENDQKRALEFCMRAPPGTKLLLTTRINFSYSTDNVLKLSGLGPDDFSDFISMLRAKYQLPQATPRQITSLKQASEGSPLFADSVLRLERRGLPLDQAIVQWKGKKGMEARKAALQREVQQLSKEAKRVLLVTSVLKNCTYTELTQILNYSEQTLGDALQELASLFLISAPAIAKEARYTVEPNTGALVQEIASQLGIDHTALVANAKKTPSDAIGISLTKRSDLVGQAISQAVSKLKAGDPRAALAVVIEAAKRQKPHPDLLMMLGRCHLEQAAPNFSDATRSFSEAYKLGQRRPLLFELWFQAEFARQDLDNAIDVANTALSIRGLDAKEWYEKRAQVRIAKGRRSQLARSVDSAIREIEDAIIDFRSARTASHSQADKSRINVLIDQSLLLKVNFLLREVNSGHTSFDALEKARILCSENSQNFEIIQRYLESVELVLLDLMKRYVGKPKGNDRVNLDNQLASSLALGSSSFAKTPPISFRNQFHSLKQNADRYFQRRDV